MGARISDETKLQITMLKKEGKTYNEIAQITGVSISTIQRICTMGMTPNNNNNITTYIPDYKMSIKPIKKRLECEYGGVMFSINLEKSQLEILDTPIDLEGVFDENNIEDLEHFGQALISISKSLDSIIISEMNDGRINRRAGGWPCYHNFSEKTE